MRRIIFVLSVIFYAHSAYAATCPANQYLSNDTCTNCIYNAECDGDKYVCDSGYYDTGENECAACPPNSTCTGPNNFACLPGFYLTDDKCAICPPNGTCPGGHETFKCNDNYYQYGSSCVQCNRNHDICENGVLIRCTQGYYLLQHVNTTQCYRCETGAWCPEGQIGAPKTCTEGSYYDTAINACRTCPAEYYCPAGEITGNYNQYCQAGYYKSNSVCIKCDDGVECPGGKPENMICSAGLYLHDDGRCLPYESEEGVWPNCNSGYYNNGAICAACPAGSTCVSETEFTCLEGYWRDETKCNTCPNDTLSCTDDGVVCKPGFFLNDNKCEACTKNKPFYCNNNIKYECPAFDPDSIKHLIPQEHTMLNIKPTVDSWASGGYIYDIKHCRIGRLYFNTPYGDYQKRSVFWDGEKYWTDETLWTSVTAGRYLANAKEFYDVTYYTTNNPCTNAPEHAIYTGPGAPNSNNCPWACDAGYIQDGNKCVTCPSGYQCVDGLLICPTGQYASGITCIDCPELYQDRAPDNTAPQSINQCQIKCDVGTYLATPNATICTNVGAGYWNDVNYTNYGSAGIRNQCPDNLTTIGYGTGADSANDCGKILHFKDHKLYLHKNKITSPSLAVQYGKHVLYGDMSPDERGHLRINLHGTVYSVFNMDID